MGDKSKLRRQIVICCDGTNNTLTGGKRDSNVVLLHNYLVSQPPRFDEERVLFYDPGVGSSGVLPPVGPVEWLGRTWERVSGLASGRGVYDNIAEAYVFLMRHWRDAGDCIYLFGFSRGAFTARAVAGMVNLFGIVRPEYEALVPMLVHLYFSPSAKSRANVVQQLTRRLHAKVGQKSAPVAGSDQGPTQLALTETRDLLVEEICTNFAGPGRRDAWVHWVGVWDTVESVGLPGLFSQTNPSPPVVVGKRYRHVRHALSLDEHRWAFLPRLYEEPGDLVGEQTLKQRWYPGVHCDAGGSYPPHESGISRAALRWMVEEVAPELGIMPMPAEPAPAVALWRHDPLWDTPAWALAGMKARPTERTLKGPGRVPVHFTAIPADNLGPATQPVHSVWEQRRALWPVLLALLLGFAALVASGLCLLGVAEVKLDDGMTVVRAVQATQDYGNQQLAALWKEGVLAPGQRPWEEVAAVQPGWAAFWDLVFVACWGYLLARISSRAFAWLAGDRNVKSPLPWWRPLGFVPLLTVSASVSEDLSLWLALVLHGVGTDRGAELALWLGGLLAMLKVFGVGGCLALLAVRCRIGFNPGLLWPHANSRHTTAKRAPLHRHHLGDAFAAVLLATAALLVWGFSRTLICWGQHDWYGVGSCHSHWAALVLMALAVLPIVRLLRELVRPLAINEEGRRTTGSRPASEGLRDLGGLGLLGALTATLIILALIVLMGWLALNPAILF